MALFDNTEIAFNYRTNGELKSAYTLFKLVSSPRLVKAGKVFLTIALKLHIPFAWLIKPTIFKHFCGGETIKESFVAVRLLEKYNIKSILDYSVEGKESIEDIELAYKETLISIKNAAEDDNIPFAVFKPTAFIKHNLLEKISAGKALSNDENLEFQIFKNKIDTLCKSAHDEDLRILIDAEHSWFQKAIDDVVEEMSEKYNKHKAIVFNTLQMYRIDRLNFLMQANEKAKEKKYFLGVKFVRGAYMEQERERAEKMNYTSPIHDNKENTDINFNLALEFSINNINRISIFCGTHNEYSCEYLTQLLHKNSLAKNDSRIFFSQLYGMSDHITFNLAYTGYNVAKYIPYGPIKHVMPYLIRRAEENTSIAGQSGRELSLIKKEMNRRR